MKNIPWRNVLYVFTWIVSLVGFFVLMGFINAKKNREVCKSVKVIVPGTQAFVSQEDVFKTIDNNGGPLVGRPLKYLPIHELENKLRENPFIKHVNVYAEMDGKVNVKIEQREAVIRIINSAGDDFYLDGSGVKFPASKLYAPHVIVANGNVSEQFNGRQDTMRSSQLKDLHKVALFLQTDSLWNSQIEQLYVNPENDMELIPRIGNQKIILGNGDSLQEKFDKLLLFYKQVIPKAGWGKYKTVNLKFANQLVCEKADSVIKKENNNKQHN
ncbi:cell division protein FtsQ [Olivibacter ginsenosidimutans]|uniref:cell division protein FtsQ n=1 Tax=Olivibacter ginsenosidimutans TaxID=1176537 RepID=UPI0031EC512C